MIRAGFGKGTTSVVPLSPEECDVALAPEVRFFALGDFFRILFRRRPPLRRKLNRWGQGRSGRLPVKSQGAEPKVEQMCDQANNLRQLVQAHRQWRELLEQPVLEPIAQRGSARDDEGRRQDCTDSNLAGFAVFVARTLEWVWACCLRKTGGRKRDSA